MASIYAQIADVQKRMPQFQITATSKPNATEAQTLIEVTESLCEVGWKNLGYVIPLTPLTGTTKNLAEEIVCQGAGARILYARAAAVGGEAAVASADRMQKAFDDLSAALADPENKLVEFTEAQRTGDAMSKPQAMTYGLTVDDEGNDIQPHVTMDTAHVPESQVM